MRNDHRLQVCNGPQLKRTFPDLDYALFGYNILNGFPLANGHDPGFTLPIFEADYSDLRQSSDCRFSIPKGLVVVPDVSCVTSFISKVVQSKHELSEALSVSAGVSGGGWGVSFSASAGYKEAASQISSGESVKIISSATCNYFFSKLIQNNPPNLTHAFRKWVIKLSGTRNKTLYFEFFNKYGTHFPTYTKFGARFSYEYTMNTKTFESQQEKGINVGIQASYSGLFSIGGGFNMDSSHKIAASEFSKSVTTKTISVGAPPPPNGDALTWASTVKEYPVPMEYKLESIDKLFSKKFMDGLGINYNDIAENINRFKLSYCNHMKETGRVYTCQRLEPGLKLSDIRLLSHYKEKPTDTIDECVEICRSTRKCLAITMHTARKNFRTCFMYNSRMKSKIQHKNENGWTSVIMTHKIDDADYLRLINARLDGRVHTMYHHSQEKVCKNDCISKAYCKAFSYNKNRNECKLYSKEDENNLLVDRYGSYVEFVPAGK